MCSTRNFTTAATLIVLSLATLSGCQRTVPPSSASPVNTTPMIIDPVMQQRDWEPSTSYYANGAAVSGGTGYLWQTHETIDPGHRRYVDVPIALLNIISLPVGLFIEGPFGQQTQRGEIIGPTYTAQPVLPPE